MSSRMFCGSGLGVGEWLAGVGGVVVVVGSLGKEITPVSKIIKF